MKIAGVLILLIGYANYLYKLLTKLRGCKTCQTAWGLFGLVRGEIVTFLHR